MENKNEKKFQNWEEEKNEMKRELFDHVKIFLDLDASFNKEILDLLKLVKKNYEKDPNAFNDSGNMKELLNQIKKRVDDDKEGVKGSDVMGSGPLQDIIEFIKSISIDLIAKEKQFFMEIIKLIFCGC